MNRASIEYLGFRTTANRREYVLRSHFGAEIHEYTVGIAHAAFAAGRARLQDGPEISFQKLQRELEVGENSLPSGDFTITDAELAAYRDAHAPPPRRQRTPPPAPQGLTKGEPPQR